MAISVIVIGRLLVPAVILIPLVGRTLLLSAENWDTLMYNHQYYKIREFRNRNINVVNCKNESYLSLCLPSFSSLSSLSSSGSLTLFLSLVYHYQHMHLRQSVFIVGHLIVTVPNHHFQIVPLVV